MSVCTVCRYWSQHNSVQIVFFYFILFIDETRICKQTVIYINIPKPNILCILCDDVFCSYSARTIIYKFGVHNVHLYGGCIYKIVCKINSNDTYKNSPMTLPEEAKLNYTRCVYVRYDTYNMYSTHCPLVYVARAYIFIICICNEKWLCVFQFCARVFLISLIHSYVRMFCCILIVCAPLTISSSLLPVLIFLVCVCGAATINGVVLYVDTIFFRIWSKH